MRRLAILLFLLSGCANADPRDPDAQLHTTIPAVEVVAARSGVLPLVERVTGTVSAAGQVTIFPDVSGPVAEVLVRNGDAVRKGDVLVRIQIAGSQAQLQQARANLNVAEAEVREIEANLANLEAQYARASELGERGIIARQEIDTLRAQVAAMNASLARARAQVGAARAAVSERSALRRQADVRSPIDGRVGQRNVEVGMRVDPQTPLFVIGRLEQMRVEAPVTQEILPRLEVGQRVEIRPQENGDPVTAEISRISPFLEPGSFSAAVEIDLSNPGALVPGMFVAVDLYYGESQPATLVPTSALYEHPQTGERGVFVLADAAPVDDDGGRLSDESTDVHFRPVEVLADGRHTVGVTGLQPDQWVVVIGQHLLSAQRGNTAQARVRVLAWDDVLALQSLQREDLLVEFMERQRQLSAVEPASRR